MAPVNVQFELTEACNLMCKFCYNSQEPIVCSNYRAIIDRLCDENVMEIVLTGGEPMLNSDFLKIAEICSEKFAKIQVQTNGTFITEEMAKKLEALGVHSVNISIHGTETTHEYLTGVRGSYQKAISGIKEILKTNVGISTNFVITSKNIEEFSGHVDYMYSLGVREFSLTRFTPTGVGACSKFLDVSKDELLKVLQYTNNKHAENKTLNFLLANSIPMCALPENLRNHCNYCHFGASRFYIDVHGNVMMCGMSRVKIGNILEKSIKEIKTHSSIYIDHVLGKGVPIKCRECEDFSSCRGGCRAAALSASGSYIGNDPLCSKMYK